MPKRTDAYSDRQDEWQRSKVAGETKTDVPTFATMNIATPVAR